MQGFEHGLVFNGGGDDVLTQILPGHGRLNNRGVITLGSPAGQDNFVIIGVDALG